MKKLFLFVISLILFSINTYSQTFTIDTIAIERRLLSANLDYKGKNLSLMKLEDICKPYTDAMDEINMAKKNSNPALILTLVGAVLIGYSGAKWLMGDDFQWYFAAGGVVMIGATIPLYIGSRNHSINAARIYNYEMHHLQNKP